MMINMSNEDKKDESIGRILYDLGERFYNGTNATQDYTKAFKYYLLSYQEGYLNASFDIGYCYYNGEGVSQNYTKAVKYFKLTPDDHTNAKFHLGHAYYYGNGVKQSYKKALPYLILCAEQKDSNAQYLLGCYYEKQDIKKAIEYYQLSAKQDDIEAINKLGEYYFNLKDYEKAFKYYSQSNDAGQLAYCYFNGIGTEQNYTKALELYTKCDNLKLMNQCQSALLSTYDKIYYDAILSFLPEDVKLIITSFL